MAGAISPFLLALSQEERIKLRSLPLRPTEDSPESPLALTVVVEVVTVVVVVPGYIFIIHLIKHRLEIPLVIEAVLTTY